MTDAAYLPLNESVDSAVRQYAEKIVEMASAFDDKAYIEVSYDDVINTSETEKGPLATLQGNFGVVVVWPNFTNGTAMATIYNRGKVQSMQLEGFEEEDIDKEVVMGRLVEFTPDNVESLAIFLTQDLGIQAQKDFRE